MAERPRINTEHVPCRAVEFLGEEYPAHFIIWNWVRELVNEGGVELLEGEIIGEARAVPPKQELYYEQGTIIAKTR